MFRDVMLASSLRWSTPLLVILIIFAMVYGVLVLRYTNIKLYQKQPLLFFLSVGLLFVTVGSPLTTLSHLSISLHMIQMSILYFVFPPLLITGIPSELVQKLEKNRTYRLLPKTALFVFAILFLMYHVPVVLNVLLRHSVVHNGYIFFLLILAITMWWPIVASDSKQHLRGEKRKKYVMLNGVLLMPACLLFVFSAFVDGINNPFLSQITSHICIPSEAINSINILPPPFNTKYDQGIAGFIMLAIHKVSLGVTTKQAHLRRTRIKRNGLAKT